MIRHPSVASRLENLVLAIVSVAGLSTLLLPFIISASARFWRPSTSRTVDASLLLAIVLSGTVIMVTAELMRRPGAGDHSRSVALLAALVAVDAALRLLPSFFGASPIFALMVLVGYTFGPQFGFIMGSLTLLLSAAITAGVGPWLPFQMLCAGWIGLTAGWLPRANSDALRLATLTIFAAASGFAYGVLMNLYSWPYAAPASESDVGLYWTPALDLGDAVGRYARFYLTTSLIHDASRAIANAMLILVVGPAVIRLLTRVRVRTEWQPALAD